MSVTGGERKGGKGRERGRFTATWGRRLTRIRRPFQTLWALLRLVIRPTRVIDRFAWFRLRLYLVSLDEVDGNVVGRKKARMGFQTGEQFERRL